VEASIAEICRVTHCFAASHMALDIAPPVTISRVTSFCRTTPLVAYMSAYKLAGVAKMCVSECRNSG